MKITIGSDHAGFALKKVLIDHLRQCGYELIDVGTDSTQPVDYPDYAEAVARVVSQGKSERGILICGSGVGMSIAANRHSAIRCVLAADTTTARLARAHNDANVLALGARLTGLLTPLKRLERAPTTFRTARLIDAVRRATEQRGGSVLDLGEA